MKGSWVTEGDSRIIALSVSLNSYLSHGEKAPTMMESKAADASHQDPTTIRSGRMLDCGKYDLGSHHAGHSAQNCLWGWSLAPVAQIAESKILVVTSQLSHPSAHPSNIPPATS